MREHGSQKDLISSLPGATWPVLREFEQHTESLSQKFISRKLVKYTSYHGKILVMRLKIHLE